VMFLTFIIAPSCTRLKDTYKVADKSYYKTPWSESGITLSSADIKATSLVTAVQVAEEGIVLLKNDGGSLPLVTEGGDIRVNVFGASSLDPEFAGGGGANVTVPCLGFYEALSDAGISYNKELYQAYSDWYDQYRNETPYAGGIVGDEGSTIWDLSSAGALNAEWNLTADLFNADGSLRKRCQPAYHSEDRYYL
jgi:hypothetical protein